MTQWPCNLAHAAVHAVGVQHTLQRLYEIHLQIFEPLSEVNVICDHGLMPSAYNALWHPDRLHDTNMPATQPSQRQGNAQAG